MKLKDSLNKRLNTRLASLVMLSVLSVPWVASAAGNSVVANNMLPGNGNVIAGTIEGGFKGSWAQGNQMNLHQTTQNAIVTWDSFSIGANATVTIRGDHDNFNMLNYVTGSESSQIYGKLNSYVGDKQGGNIYLVNPNGVQIGNSAEINVGSLHIANKKIDNINRWNENTDIANELKKNKAMTNAELMSLGYINANKLVFEGERVVIDMDRLSGLDTTKADALTIVSQPYDGKSFNDNRKYDIVLGSSTPKSEKAKKWGEYIEFADNVTGDRLQGTVQAGNPDAPNQSITEFFTYRWIKDGKELEKIGKETGWGMGDHYALRYSIDLTGSDQTPIGNTKDNAFKGKFDGLDNSIFGLSIDNSDNKKGDATGLFGFTDGAIMGNVTLIAGNDGVSIQGGNTDTGAFIGHAVNTTVKGVNSTLKVSGKNNVGGIIGYAKDDTGRTYSVADAAGSVQPDSRSSELSNLTNTGNVSGVSNVGGLVGYMNGGKLSNDEENRVQYKGSYNLGKITGIDNGSNYSYNIGGMIGKAENATVGGTKNTLINYNTVEGGYNVGGIVGSISNNTTVANASNEGVVKANGFTIDSYIYHTDYTGSNWQNNNEALPGTHKAEVRAANVGGIVGSIAGSELKDVTNKADVSSALVKKTANNNNDPRGFDHYAAGNVGGIVGRAEDSNITNANNVESNIRGAMNVGGIAGYFGSTDATNKNKKDYRILNAINNGGDIMATGGIKKDGSFTQEITHKETYITGNIGGIAGYLYGVPVRIEAGGNRGDVHTAADTSKRTSQAVNVGGIVGKIDMPKKTDSDGNRLTDDNRLAIIKGNATDAAGKSGYASAAVSSSYNTGNVTGYTNIGGIGGFAYNGSIAASYNVGDIKTTRHDAASTGVTPINMGGILGESTEMAIGRVIIYDTYNKGTIGDSSYTTYGRHVGGIVGRLSGIVEKSYNNGDIYNGFNVVGGIAGYWYSGYLKNVFNTGNITVYNKNNAPSQVGGIVGSVDLSGGNLSSGSNAALSISNAYNLGSLRSFMGGGKYNEVGGILGGTFNYSGTSNRLKISNAYTMGNIYVDKLYAAGGFVGDIVGAFDRGTNRSFVDFENVYYIRPQADNGYFDLASAPNSGYLQKNATVIDYDKLNDPNAWSKFSFSKQTDGKIEGATDDNWRMSDGSLPILNAFLSGSHNYFSDNSNWQEFIKDNKGANVQYGTAYDPLLTIINTKKDLSFNWSDMDLKNNGSLAVFGLPNADNTLRYTPGLTLNNVEITNSTHIFGGTIYSDGVLKLNAKDDLQGGLRFGMDSMLYGSDVVLNTNSSLELSGSVISTGNHNALSGFNPEKSLQHGININAGDLTVYGKLITLGDEKKGTEVIVPGINYGYVDSQAPDKDNVKDKTKAMTSQGMTHAYQLQTATAKTGNITISTMENPLADGTHMSGSANLLYGNYKKGKIETKGNLNVSSSGDILVDSDLDVAGSIKLEGAEVPDGSGYLYVNNITLDLSNIGGELKGNDKAKALHDFIDAHNTAATGIYGNNNSGFADDKRSMKITLDCWDDDYEVGGVKGNLNYTKYDLKKDDNTTVKLTDKLQSLYVQSDGENYTGDKIHNIIYAWISNAEELNSVQRVAENLTDRDALSYNYVLKNDIDASGLVNAQGKSTYNTIGGGTTAFTGTFDGNGHAIVGLQANGGIFGKLGSGAVVKNINIVSSVFTGKEDGASVGAVAAENNGGEISNISGYGNTVKGNGGYIGGLVGKNYGSITDSNDQSTVIAGENTVAGGIAGVNGKPANTELVFIENVQSNSAVTTDNLASGKYADNLGGIVGKNEQLIENSFGVNINNVSAHGVTGKAGNTKTSGGIVGTNEGIISNAYNESIIHGSENIGGVAGKNGTETSNSKLTELNDVANAVEIIGDAGSQNVGGLVGMQEHATTNQGRNTGAITGCTNVGGMVGYNKADSYLKNLENSPQATITGITNVGGIAGVNEGEISADNQLNLVNSGKIYGWENVGGIAGKNSGKIDNVNSNINLYVIGEPTRKALKGSTSIADNAQFFGGVTGENVGIITNATNRARVDAAQASYVGGIVGKNTSDGDKVGQLLGMGNSNEGLVIGKNYVGGVIGKNEVAITGTSEQSVGIVNSGTVIALAGGAGGIIGENSADITHVIMKNEGEVHGNASIEGSMEENGTGGIIGVNGYKADGTGANISNSSLMNRVNGNVSGVANVGGIIGINHGIITGGRDANNNYYKYQIYNNGTIQAGSYDAERGTIKAVPGENIGGLLGNNSGTLTAGYNTGVVDAGQSSNVGGIAGTNSGTLDQVFNSVVTVTKTETGATDADGRKLYNYTYTDGGAISGASNVGGIVGSNTGTLSNAYSTTAVAGNSNVANIVGSNAGNVSNVYGYAANGNTNVNNGTVTNSYIINADGKLQENGKDAKKLDSYDFDNKKTTWKLYDKRTNPLLKVFLTKVTVADDLQKGWVYDATNHLDIPGWIENGKLSTVDPKNDAFAAYKNNNSLLQGENLKNVGDYSSWLWSGQIASGGEVGPNNLGYDFTVGDITIIKKVLNVTGNTVNRTYGKLQKDHDYALSINGFDSFNDAMKAELDGKVTITDSQKTIQDSQDKGIITVDSEKRTNNKGSYTWHAGVELDNSLIGNYKFQNNGESSTTTTVHGKSNVLARKVYLNNINAKLTYGSKDAINNHINGVVSIKDLANAIVYGDDVKLADGAVVKVKDGSKYAVNKGDRNTADADTYADSLKIDNAALTGDASKLGNYELVNDATGSITVEQAEMHVTLNGVERTYGNAALINGTSYGVNRLTGNVNGDNYGAGDVTLGTASDGALTGASTGKVTNDAGDTYKWNANVVAANDKLKQNYKLVVDDGASVVKQATLSVSLNDVVRTYGNATITSGSYGVSGIEGLVNGDNYDASAITVNKTSDGAIDGVSGSNRVTNDAGGYTWSGDLTTENAALKNNYKLELKGDGKSVVGKATLNVGLSDVVRTYGNAKITNGSYSAGNITGLVNGDNYDASDFKVTVNSDGAIAGVTGDRVTNDHGDYTWGGTVEVANAGLNKNYDLVVNGNGNSYVGKAQLSVSLNDVVRAYGNATITSGGYSASGIEGLVNGDSYKAGDVKVTVTGDGAIDGVSGSDRVTNDAGNYEWTGSASTTNAGLDKNYNLVVTANGKSTVEKATLNVGLSDVVRTYGNATITSGGYSASNITGLVNGDSYNASDVKVTVNSDGAVDGVSTGKVTNDAGDYSWSGTVEAANAGLGKNYNLVVTANGKSTVEKATLNVGLNDVVRTYGNAAITSGGYSASNITGLVNGDSYKAGDVKVTVTGDGALTGASTGKVTNDAGDYSWSGTLTTDNAGLDKNYNLVVTANGKSTVEKATLNVGLSDVVRTYGNATITSGSYSAGNITGLVNGDSYKAGDVKVTVTGDGALTGASTGKVTNDAGDYNWSGTLTTDNAGLGKNYNLVVTANGKSTVEKATLNVGLNDVVRTYGNATITGGGYSAGSVTGLVNGDSYNASDVKVTVTGDGAVDGVSTGKVTNDAGDYNWSGTLTTDNAGLDKNYNLVVTANGKSTVEKATLNVGLNDVVRTYGNATITGGGYSAGSVTGLVNGDSYNASDVKVTVTGDGAVDGVSTGKVTNDAGDYNWSGTLTTDNAGLDKNYNLVVTANGKSTVEKATLNVGLNDVVRTYGNATITSGGYSAGNITGLVNGDSYNASDVKVTVTGDGAIDGVSGSSKVTNDAGNYEWTGSASTTNAGLDKNYNLVVTANGKSTVEKATLNVGLNDVVRTYGNAAITSGGYSASNITGLVNGDSYNAGDVKVTVTGDGAIAGVSGSKVTNDAGDYTWNGTLTTDNAGLDKNYKLVVTANGKSKVEKATLNVGLNDVVRTYGNATITSGGYSASNITGLVNGDSYKAGDVKVTVTSDGAIDGVSDNRVTNDAGNYEWTGSASTTNAGLDKNYNLVVTANGKSTVEKATLNVGLNDVVRTYGNATITSGGYSASNITGLVNGDSYSASDVKVTVTGDGALTGASTGKVTNDAGDYSWSGTLTADNAGLDKNYNLVVTANGKSTVEKATLNVGLNDVVRTYGNATITSGGYSAGNITGLVNGDSYNASDVKVTVNSDGAVAGVSGSKVTNDAGDYTWNGTLTTDNAGLDKNYNLVVTANGKSTVEKATLNVGLSDVVRTYGNAAITSGGYSASGIEGLVNGDSYKASDVKVTVTGDGALTGNTEGKVTNDAGDYSWSGTLTTDNAGLGKNYNLVVTANGKSKVEKATLNVGLSDVYRTYGNAAITSGSYSASNITGLVNGDSYNAGDVKVTVTGDGATDGVSGSKVTNDAGNYEWTGSASTTNAGLGKNYNLVVTANGKSTVEKATLNVGLNDVVRTYGNATITSGGYSASNITGLVNGDSYNASDVKVMVNSDGAVAGVSGSKVTNDAGDYSWNGTLTTDNAGLDKNYNLVVAANGKSTVEKAMLNVGLNDVVRTYGNATITSGGYSASGITGLVNGDSYNASDVKVTVNSDGAVAGVSGSKVTNDAGDYSWSGTVEAANAGLDKNYDLVVTANGKSTVEKANLVVNLKDITRVYGNLEAKDYKNAYTFGADAGLVNGDSGLVIKADKDGAIAEGSVSDVKKTNNVGNYEWNGAASGVDNLNTNYNVQINAGKSDVTKANLVVNLNDITRVYGNLDAKDYSNAFTFGANAGLVNGDSGLVINADKDGAIAEGSVTDVKKTNNVGSYKWNGTASGVDNLNTNYDVTVNAGKSDVTKAKLVVNLNDITRVYGNLEAKDYSNAFTFGTNAGLVNGDSGLVINADKDGAIAEGSVSDVKKTNNVGNYEWNGAVSGVDNLNTNYDVTVNAGKSNVTKANLVVNLNDITRVYGNLDAKDYSNAFTFGNNAGLVNGDSGLVINADKDGAITEGSVSDVKKTNNVGKYEWNGTASGVDNLNTNYDVTVNAGKSDVTKANLVVNLNDITRVYGNLDAKDYSNAFTFGTNAGLVNGDSGLVINADKDGAIAEGSVSDVKKTNNVGKYEWNGTASGVDNLNTNYDVTVNAGKSDVTKANLVVNLNDITRVYGNLDAKDYSKAFTFGNNAGLVNGDNGLVINANKDGAITGGTLTNVEKTNNVGNYEWNGTASGVDNLNTNYDVQINAGKSDVTKAKLVVNLTDITRIYGNLDAKDYSNTFTFGANAGLVNGDNGLVINANKDGAIAGGTLTNVEKTNNVGNYEWNGTASGVENLKTNYNVTVNAGKSDVTKANLVVNLKDITRVYGNLDAKNYSKEFTYGENAGLVNGDSGLVINAKEDGAIAGGTLTNVEKTSNAGSYTWNGTASGVDNLKTNYNVTVNAGKSDVTKANLVVNLKDITRVYGNLDAKNYSKEFTYGENAGLVNGDSGLVINAKEDGAIVGGTLTNVEKTSNAGSYTWNGTASGVDNLKTNYNVTVNAGKSDVTKANLVVNLKDITRVYGNLDAKDYKNAYTFGANAGLVNGDNGLVINAKEDGAIAGGTLTNVEKTSNAGKYSWSGTASGVANLDTNYNVTVNAGKSAVTKANLVVNLKDITRVYGNLDAKNYSKEFTYGENAGLVNGDSGLVINAKEDGAIVGGTLTNVEKTSNAGSYTWNGTASGVDNLKTNYNVTVNAGKSAVTKANLVVNLNDITRVYGNLDAKDYKNAYTFGANAGLVNGDNGLVINAKEDGAIAGGTLTNVEKTSNAGSYTWNGTASGVDNLKTNYNVTVNAGKSDVTKANLVVNLKDITRVYGNLEAKDYSKEFTYGENAGLVNGDSGLVINAKEDGAIVGGTLTNVEKTSNAGSYTWNGTASGVDNLKTNYNVTVNAGKSDVTKANLVVNLKDITRIYGNLDAKDYSNAYTFGANAGLVNGDSGLVINPNADGAIAEGSVTDVKKTSNVGSYEWNGTASGVENLNHNYNVQINAGKSDVTPAKLTFVVDDKTITQGVPTEYTGKANGLTNGDTLAGIGVGGYELDSSVNPLIVGVYEDKIGVLINGSVHLTGGDDLLKNYRVEIDPGTLTVLASFNPADDYWCGTAPWDKERNLRERKAEIHYVAGGMSL